MRFFVQATSAPDLKTKNTRVVSMLLAVIILVMVVAQLFSYDKFIPLLEAFLLPIGEVGIRVLGALIVITEVLALPFLLRMRLSPAMRFMSMVSGWVALTIWLILQILLNSHRFLAIGATPTSNAGLLGASVSVTVGWWSVFVMAALIVLAVWSAWGMWPGKQRKVAHRATT